MCDPLLLEKSDDVAEDVTVERLSRARKRIQMISTLGMFRGTTSTEKSIKIFKTIIRPLWEYSIHLTPRALFQYISIAIYCNKQ